MRNARRKIAILGIIPLGLSFCATPSRAEFVSLTIIDSGSIPGVPCVTATMAVESEYENIPLLQNDSVHQSEWSIAISPVSPHNILIGANVVIVGGTSVYQGVYLSSDGGDNWDGNDFSFGSSALSTADPVVEFDASGNAYFCYVEVSGFTDWQIVLKRSTDGGVNWTSEARPDGITSSDKPHMTVDRNSGAVYVAWTEFSRYPGKVVQFTRSDGANWPQFTTPINISSPDTTEIQSTEYGFGINLAVGPNGEVYAAWLDVSTDSLIMFNKSLDGGSTWGAPSGVPISGIGDIAYQFDAFYPTCASCDSIPCDSISCPSCEGYVYYKWSGEPPCDTATCPQSACEPCGSAT